MAPEILLCEKYDEKCDVFGFGAVLAGIVSRRRPPKRDERSNHAFKTDQLKSLIPADCPPKLVSLVMQCCESDASKRPSFDAILEVLSDLLENELKPDPEGGPEA